MRLMGLVGPMGFFAQEYSAPEGLVTFVECAFWVMAFIGVAVATFRQIVPRKEKRVEFSPQPLVVKEHDEFVTRPEFNRHVDDVNLRLLRLGQEAIEGRRNLHRSIEETPGKVIALLRDTKGLL